jgi:hypothetical protein
MLYLSISRFKSFAKLAPEVVNEAFLSVAAQRTSQLLKTLPLFDWLCLSSSKTPPAALAPPAAAAESRERCACADSSLLMNSARADGSGRQAAPQQA